MYRSHGGSLLNDGDTLYLLDAHHNYIDYVSYDDGQDSHDVFPSEADAEGPSIELTDANLDNNIGTNWQASSQINGTPGYQNTDGTVTELVFIGFGTVGPESIEITMDTPYDVPGFQMDITGVLLGEASGIKAQMQTLLYLLVPYLQLLDFHLQVDSYRLEVMVF